MFKNRSMTLQKQPRSGISHRSSPRATARKNIGRALDDVDKGARSPPLRSRRPRRSWAPHLQNVVAWRGTNWTALRTHSLVPDHRALLNPEDSMIVDPVSQTAMLTAAARAAESGRTHP